MATLAEVLDVLDDHPHVALNLDIKQTAPAVEPYEELLARELAGRRFTDRIIVASFLDIATDVVRHVRARHRHLGRDARHGHVLAGRARGRGAARHGARGPAGACHPGRPRRRGRGA